MTGAPTPSNHPPLRPTLRAYLDQRATEFGAIAIARRQLLDPLSEHIRTQLAAGHPLHLVFVCTHNSRRSQLAQLWAAAAADYCGVALTAHSCGTEVTAFNPRAVAALQRAGFAVEHTSAGDNPLYHVRLRDDATPPSACFSKRFDDPTLPRAPFTAIMVCDAADRACPSVPGASARFALPYQDPKRADDTAAESSTYDASCTEIAREILHVLTHAAGRMPTPRPATATR